MAETVDLVDNRLPMILCSEQFGIVAKNPGCNSGSGIEPTSDVWAVRRKYCGTCDGAFFMIGGHLGNHFNHFSGA
jgi:hypothetical protein